MERRHLKINRKIGFWSGILFLVLIVIYQFNEISKIKNQNEKELMVQINSLIEEKEALKQDNLELNNEIRNLKNQIPKVYDAQFLVDGDIKEFKEKEGAIEYSNQIYIPVTFINTAFGKSLEIDDRSQESKWVNIGRSVLGEGFRPIHPIISQESSINDLIAVLGQPISQNTYEHYNTGVEETEAVFQGVEVITGRNITVTEPVLETYRGITIGSTKEEVIAQYGEPDGEWSHDNRWVYGDYKANLWFEFENNKVISFGVYHIDT